MSAKSSKVNERLKTIQVAFHVGINLKFKPIECKITYLLYIVRLELDSSVAKKAKILTVFVILYYVTYIKFCPILFCDLVPKTLIVLPWLYGISLKTGIEPRFCLSEFTKPHKLDVLLGKLRNFMKFSHGIL